jgi:hypothetical protein
MKGKDFQFLSFGSGRRICPGINFGVATVEIMLANLMYHFDWDLQDDMTELFGLTLRRKEKLILVSKGPFGWGAALNGTVPFQFLRMEPFHSTFGKENGAIPFSVWLESALE